MSESERRVVVEDVDFSALRFPRLFRAVTLAIAPTRMVIALFMVAAIMAVGETWDGLRPSDAAGSPPFEALVDSSRAALGEIIGGTISLRPDRLWDGLVRMGHTTPLNAWKESPIFAIVFGLIFSVVLAVGGGAISRMTAVELATGQRQRVSESMMFATTGVGRLAGALLLPLVVAGVVAVVMAAAGWLLFLPVLDVIGGLLYVVMMLAALAVVFLLLGYALGFVMLVPAVSCENCEAPDALQRAYSYVLNRPAHLVGYFVVGLVGLVIGMVIVRAVAGGTVYLAGALGGAWTGNEAMGVAGILPALGSAEIGSIGSDWPWHSKIAAWFIRFWQGLAAAVVVAYLLSYFYSASTILYLLMRRACDGQELTEIWQAESAPESEEA